MSLVPETAAARLGRGPAAIQLFTKGGFAERLKDAGEGRVPRDFFYGFLGLVGRGYDARWQRTDAAYEDAGSTARPSARAPGQPSDWSQPTPSGAQGKWAQNVVTPKLPSASPIISA